MPDDREIEQAEFAELRRTGDPKLRDRLVEEHLWLARHCARRFSGRGESADDLTQVANLALVKAVDRFDPTFQVRFTTFAVPTIVGELRRHFRDRTWSMRVSRRLKDLHLELKAASEQLAHDLGSLAHRRRAGRRPRLHSRRTCSRRSRPAPPTAPPASPPGSAPRRARRSSRASTTRTSRTRASASLLQEALGTLPERERRVVYLRFYLGLTQSEIAEEIGVSQVHVSRILRSTLNQLGDELGDDAAELLEPG